MITSEAWRGKRYAVLGLARSGAATVRALLASGAEVVAWDERAEARNRLVVPAEAGTSTRLARHSQTEVPASAGATGALSFADPLTIDLTGFDGIVVSPGVPINRHPIAEAARAANVPLIGDIELFAQARPGLPPHKVVGITGTNGKSTTTALIHHILKTASVPSLMGGNIGLPILEQEPLPEGGVYVLELSSYQIDLTFSLDCDVAVLLNLSPDHLDRYDSEEAYYASKARLFGMQTPDRLRVFPEDAWFSGQPLDQLEREVLHHFLTDDDKKLPGQTEWPSLQGPHNAENAAAALHVTRHLGVSNEVMQAALRTYPGLPHRMERVRELRGVLYVNDSKATNATSAAPALAAYPAVHWILGGRAKTDELDACAPHFDHVRAAYTIGEAGPMFARLLAPHMKVTESVTLERAVNDASAAAVAGETVLLSPACASFDQFKDFEARGDAFKAYVGALA